MNVEIEKFHEREWGVALREE